MSGKYIYAGNTLYTQKTKLTEQRSEGEYGSRISDAMNGLMNDKSSGNALASSATAAGTTSGSLEEPTPSLLGECQQRFRDSPTEPSGAEWLSSSLLRLYVPVPAVLELPGLASPGSDSLAAAAVDRVGAAFVPPSATRPSSFPFPLPVPVPSPQPFPFHFPFPTPLPIAVERDERPPLSSLPFFLSPDSAHGTRVEPRLGPDSETVVKTDLEPDPDSHHNPDPEPKPDPEPDPEPEPESEPEPDGDPGGTSCTATVGLGLAASRAASAVATPAPSVPWAIWANMSDGSAMSLASFVFLNCLVRSGLDKLCTVSPGGVGSTSVYLSPFDVAAAIAARFCHLCGVASGYDTVYVRGG